MYSQNYFDTYNTILNEHELVESESKVDSLLKNLAAKNDTIAYIHVAHEYSLALIRNGEVDKAIKYGNLEVASYKKINSYGKDFSRALFNLGKFYATNKQFEEALVLLKELISFKNRDRYTADAFCEIGRIYRISGDFYTSVFYYKKGIEELEGLEESKKLIKNYLNFLFVYNEIDTEESLAGTLECLKKIDSLRAKTTIRARDELILLNGFANYYNNESTFNFESSKEYYFKAIALAAETENSETLHESYNNLGFLYNTVKNDSAYYYLNKALKYDPKNGSTYHILADYAILKKDYKKALDYIQTSIKAHSKTIFNESGDLSVTQLPEDVDVVSIIISLYKKATILVLQHESTNDLNVLNQALVNLSSAELLLAKLQNESKEVSSKLHWRSESSAVYVLGVYIAELLNDDALAFSYMEKNQALLLKEAIIDNTVKEQIPIKYRDRDLNLRKKITKLEIDLAAHNNYELRDSLFFLKLKYESFQDSVKVMTSSSDLLALKAPLSLKEVKEKMDTDDVIVSQIWNTKDEFSTALFTLWISKEKTILKKIPSNLEIETSVTQLKNLLTVPFDTKENHNKFQIASHSLYNTLFSSKDIKKMVKGKHLLIIPDGDFKNFPFDILLTSANENDYLIKTNNVSYANSVSYLFQNNERKRKAKNNFIGFAPIKYENDGLTRLNNSKNEIFESLKVFNGESFYEDDASKLNFLNQSNNYNIIHLATHAAATESPWIAFSDDKLYLNEIYTSKNQAELVVLSGCSTSQGENVKGEGVLSLARGFFYAGANSVLSNAWEANDKSTSEIIKRFYAHLKNGDTKTKALRKAKLEYLEAHSLSEASPNYWASLLLMGNYGDIHFTDKTGNFSYYVILLCYLTSYYAISITAIRLFKKKKKFRVTK